MLPRCSIAFDGIEFGSQIHDFVHCTPNAKIFYNKDHFSWLLDKDSKRTPSMNQKNLGSKEGNELILKSKFGLNLVCFRNQYSGKIHTLNIN